METEKLNQVLLNENNLIGADLDTWLARGGGRGLANALQNPDQILATLEAADLRGMGGAGFPTHRKWGAVAAQDAPDKWLICNGNEDEPGTFKDRLLLEKAPHQVLEGALIAAIATGANHIAIYINPHEEEAINTMRRAIGQWKAQASELALAPGRIKTFKVVVSSGLYIGGEESAAMSTVEGGFPFPRRKPPFPFESGVRGCPTAINNVETYAHVTHILRNGAQWYRDLGIGNAAGTKIFSLSGDVLKPGAYELPMGISLRSLIYVYGGGMLQGKEFKAVFTGGPSNTILNKNDLDVALDFDSVRERRSSLGTGAMIVISEGTGIVKRVTQYVDFFAHSSCGQCPPCKIGTHQMSRLLQKIDTGQGRRADLDSLINLSKMLPGSGRCGLITGAATVLDSSLYKFRDEYERHLQDR
jgi:NADH-quinone oxidoreductase subunit F